LVNLRQVFEHADFLVLLHEGESQSEVVLVSFLEFVGQIGFLVSVTVVQRELHELLQQFHPVHLAGLHHFEEVRFKVACHLREPQDDALVEVGVAFGKLVPYTLALFLPVAIDPQHHVVAQQSIFILGLVLYVIAILVLAQVLIGVTDLLEEGVVLEEVDQLLGTHLV